MRCERCKKEIDETIAYKDAGKFGKPIRYSCPHCGKMYTFTRYVYMKITDDPLIKTGDRDDYGGVIITDLDYYRGMRKEENK